ncbi:late embryogenesis abundant protein D-34-like isoform X1 [Prosopis cineraria]|uniref:late embryogenesis abundant protein D-34-like isoform X1 n=1 Tax=Prosopis cineraria TaxID=364024 RepID=UPI00240F9E26|nr:late embryogenesis abundant protein D-34-like isoform X1 [Prosopis cineraria]
MSQEQRRRLLQEEPIKYGDLFNVQGELASMPVTPKDASMMQSAENAMLGKTLRGGAAAVMQSAAMKNERAGHVGHKDMTASAADLGVSVTETDLEGKRVIVESFGGQVIQRVEGNARKIHQLVEEQAVEHYDKKVTMQTVAPPSRTQEDARVGLGGCGGITIGEALEATAVTAGNKPVEWSDAAAIQAAEVRATGRTNIVPGGVAAAAQSAATLNARLTNNTDKTTLADILNDATSKLPSDKVATRKDAEGVTVAEMRNNPNLAIHPAGVSVSVTAAARLNQIHN